MSSYHRIQTEDWLKTIDVKADRVLDIGGSQLPIKGRTKSWDVKEYKILDLYEPHECNVNPDMLIDINEDMYLNQNEKDKLFDVAFCIEVSEYFYNPMKAFKNINSLLVSGGILYITFPFVYGCHKPSGKDFLRYTPIGAEELLRKTGFKILEHKYRKTNGNQLGDFYKQEKMKVLPDFNEIIGSMIKAQKI
jgi:SAM-dependent methyltransferase